MVIFILAACTDNKRADNNTKSEQELAQAEEVEEEESASGVLQKVKLAGESGSGLYMLDQELAQRVFNSPAASE